MTDIDWREGDADAAFAEAASRNLPVLLYWGARWCPPCNRAKACFFPRHDFLALKERFVALHIDGDGPAAQEQGERFHLRSYPTLVLYRPDGKEVTRLPTDVDGARFVQLLTLALGARFTSAELLAVALSRERVLSDDEWRQLTFYDWSNDEAQLTGQLDFAAIVASLSRACTLPEASVRLAWLALHAAAAAREMGIDQRAAIASLEETLNDPRAVHAQMDIVINFAVPLLRFLTTPGSMERTALVQSWSRALTGLESDAALSVADHLSALRARVRLSKMDLRGENLDTLARERVANAAYTIHQPALRHTVINTGSGILSDAGLLDEAAQLVVDELPRSHAPFYFMHNLAGIAKKRGDTAGVISWYRQAWEQAEGPATRLQWGATYLLALLDGAPAEAERVEALAAELLAELRANSDCRFQRNRTQLARIEAKLAAFDGGEQTRALHAAAAEGLAGH